MNENVSGLSLTYFDFFLLLSPFLLPLYIIDFFKYFKWQLKPDLILGLALSKSQPVVNGFVGFERERK